MQICISWGKFEASNFALDCYVGLAKDCSVLPSRRGEKIDTLREQRFYARREFDDSVFISMEEAKGRTRNVGIRSF